MSEPPASPSPPPGTRPAGKHSWLGRLSASLASFAGGWAADDFKSTLGFHGLAGAIAFMAVVTAATWIRGLDPRARLPRRAPWLFLGPAAVAAASAAFSSGTAASILTAAAAILTVGAVLIAKELQSAARLLTGAALIVGGAAIIAAGAASIADGNTPLGTALIPGAVAYLTAGVAYIGDRDTVAGAAIITAGAALIMAGAALIAAGAAVNAIFNTTIGLASIFGNGAMLIFVGPGIISSSRGQGSAAYLPDHIRRAHVAFVNLYAALTAIFTAVIAGGSTKVTKDVTPGGAAHIAESGTLLWVTLIAILAGAGVLVAASIGPRVLAAWLGQAIDWATKAPQASQEHDTQPRPDGSAE